MGVQTKFSCVQPRGGGSKNVFELDGIGVENKGNLDRGGGHKKIDFHLEGNQPSARWKWSLGVTWENEFEFEVTGGGKKIEFQLEGEDSKTKIEFEDD